ncbi:MAG TPA: TatD family hydrolase [Chitinophagaceae bacterium]|nr:TatD family hydrolase [Chitinophagaceae bacterium]
MSSTPLLDIHTHNLSIGASHLIFNPSNIEVPSSYKNKTGVYVSVGFHPWHLESSYNEKEWSTFEELSLSDDIIAIGEAGLDKIKGAPMDLQQESFQRQIAWASKVQKPIIVHNVRASEEVWHALKKEEGNLTAIMHAFRRNKKVAQRFLDLGHYLSFGHPLLFDKNLQEVLKYIPKDRFFLETDGFDGVFIKEMYEKAAAILKTDISSVSLQTFENFNTLFPKNKIDYGAPKLVIKN